MNEDITFGSFVKKHRMSLGLTQAELAARVGCATITLRKIESDTLRPSIQIAERLAMALDIPLEERADFVRLARIALLGTPEPPSVPTPSPLPEEIGGEDLSGRAVRGYELGERIGSGGFGAVYRAVQPGVEREVALKIILPQYANHPDFIRRFEAEAHLVARLEHPFIVPLYDYWREPNAAFLVMRLLRGGSLSASLKDDPLPLEFVWRVLEQIGNALHAAHRFGVIHRDLKPANILLDEDQNAYLADFGIAKNLGNPNLEDQTQAGQWMGSPAYTPPEQIRSETIRPQTDIYCLGILLYELLTGELPFKGPTPLDYIMQHLKEPLPPLARCNPNAPTYFDPIIQRATAKNPNDRFPDIPTLLAEVREAIIRSDGEVISEISRQSTVTDIDPAAIENPFKGLRPFAEADAEDFFGRKALIQDLLSRLGEENDVSRFLAVVGPSGSGKSSVVKAGLIPAIRRGALPGSENWFIVDFMPGAHPLEELEAALLRIAVNPPESLLGQLREDERGLHRAVKRILPADESIELVLVVDQFEEVFTLLQDETERAHFLDSLVAAVLNPRSRFRVVLTMRADFTDRPLGYVDFGELIRKRTEFVLPLTPDELELAVTGPAKKAGLIVELGLTAQIVRELGDQPGTLPLLQYALTELFEHREGRRLTLKAYNEIGGVLGALGRRAEEIYTTLDEPAQTAARQSFLRLVTLGEGVEDTRRRVLQTELEGLNTKEAAYSLTIKESTKDHQEYLSELGGTKISSVIETFGKARLLTFDHDPVTRGPTVEVAHEALLREWPRLRNWLNDNRTDIRMQRTLANLAGEWAKANRDPSFLLRGARLDQFEGWREATELAFTRAEGDFLKASLADRDRRQAEETARQAREVALEQRSRNFLRALVGVFAVATVIAVFLSVFAFNQQGIAQSESQSRATQQAIAEEQAGIAAANAADALAEADLATGRELALQSFLQLENDAERSILLALTSLQTAYTPEGEEMLHASIQSSRTLLTIPAVGGRYDFFAYSPDGSRLAASSDEYSAISWDTATGQELFRVPDLGDVPAGEEFPLITFSPDGSVLAVGEDDGSLWILDAASGETLMELVGHSDWYSALEFSPDGTRIATANLDGTVRMWDAGVGELLYTLDIPVLQFGGNYLRFSRDGKYLLIAIWDWENGELRIVEAATGQVVAGFSRGWRQLQFIPDGSLLAIIPEIDTTVVEFWDFNMLLEEKADEPVFTLTNTHVLSMVDVMFSPDGSLMATSSQDGTVKIWSFSPEGVEELFTLSSMFTLGYPSIVFSPDGRTLATMGASAIQTWDVTPGGAKELLTLTGHTAPVGTVVYSPDGALLATGSRDGTVRIWDSETGALGQILSPIENAGPIGNVAFNPEGTRLAADGGEGLIWVWDVETWQLLLTLSGHEEDVRDISFSPDGRTLASTSNDGTARIWDPQTGELLKTLPVHPSQYQGRSLAFSPDGALLATESNNFGPVEDNSPALAIIWDLTTYQELLRIPLPDRSLIAAFSPDGTQLVAVGEGNTIVFHDTTTGEELFSLSGHTRRVISVVFSPDGSRLYSAGLDGPKVWDLASRQELYSLFGHTGPVPGISLSPDGTRLATSSADGTARVYVMDIDDLIALALERVSRWFTPEECLEYLHTETCPPDIRPAP